MHPQLALRHQRSSPQDLEISGDLAGFVTYADLMKLPQTRFSARGDANFPHGAELSGVSLDDLIRSLGGSLSGELVAAVCDDGYEAHYTSEYRSAHQPYLVLSINGRQPGGWGKIGDGSYRPYLISHAGFTPAFRIVSHPDEPQIPYGVVELKLMRQDTVLNALRPAAEGLADSPERKGYEIAFQNCLRCHNDGAIGGRKSGVDWQTVAREANRDPAGFRALIRDPQSRNRSASMPANPQYDTQTLQALTAYFQAFHSGRNR